MHDGTCVCVLLRRPRVCRAATAAAMAAMLEGMVDKVVQIVTNDGRNIVGTLKGFDQTTNIILDECHERVFSSEAGVEQARTTSGPRPSAVVSISARHSSQVVLGLYIVRGDNMCGTGPQAWHLLHL